MYKMTFKKLKKKKKETLVLHRGNRKGDMKARD